MPGFAVITDGKKSDIWAAEKNIKGFPKGSIIVADRGYLKSDFLQKLEERGCNYVIRNKDNILYTVLRSNALPKPVGRPSLNNNQDTDETKTQIIRDEIVRFSGAKSSKNHPGKIRLVTAMVADSSKKQKERIKMSFFTNLFHLSAVRIADIYKERWNIESFFRTIKQNLMVKSFLGHSKGAFKIQIYCALIVMLLLEFWKNQTKRGWATSCLLYTFRISLVSFNRLQDILDSPLRALKNGRPPPKEETSAAVSRSTLF
jgi:transposase